MNKRVRNKKRNRKLYEFMANIQSVVNESNDSRAKQSLMDLREELGMNEPKNKNGKFYVYVFDDGNNTTIYEGASDSIWQCELETIRFLTQETGFLDDVQLYEAFEELPEEVLSDYNGRMISLTAQELYDTAVKYDSEESLYDSLDCDKIMRLVDKK